MPAAPLLIDVGCVRSYGLKDGLSVAAIARRLNEDGVSTPRGGRWHSPGVKRALGWVRS
jgi:hypothetical protein